MAKTYQSTVYTGAHNGDQQGGEEQQSVQL